MDTLRDLDLVRAVQLRTELRAADDSDSTDDADGANDNSMPTMIVRFAPFDTWYEIDSFWEGTFMERTVRGAFAKTIKENGPNVKVLFNHGMDFNIGDKMLGMPENLREDKDAAALDSPLFDTSYNRDLIPGLQAGAYGSSFMFRVIRDEWNDEPDPSDTNPKGLPERTIKEVRLFEAGPVTWPANPSATAGVRSLTDEYYERVRAHDPQRYETLRSRVLNLRTPEVDAGRQHDAVTSTDGAADISTDAPDLTLVGHHPGGLTPSQRRVRLYSFLEEAS